MMAFYKRYRWKIQIALSVIVLIAGWLWGPSLVFQWNYSQQWNQYRSNLAQIAESLLPQVENSTTASLHFLYQDLMKAAGQGWDAERQYQQWSSKDPQNPALLALYSRIVSDSEKKSTLLKNAIELEPENDAVLMVQIETILQEGKTAPAQKLLPLVKSDHWLRWGMESRIAERMGQIDRAKELFQKALNDGAVPISVGIEYARFLTLWTDFRAGSIPNPFARWGQEILDQEPVAYAYHVWLSQKPFESGIEDLPVSVQYDPDALALLCQSILFSRINASDPSSNPNLSGKHLEYSQKHRIEIFLKQASQMSAQNPEVVFSQGLYAWLMNDSQTANRYFNMGIYRETDSFGREYHERMGDRLACLGQIDLAVKHYEKNGNRLPENALFLKKLADLRLKEKKYVQAVPILEQIRSFCPRDVFVLRNLAETYMQQDQIDKSRFMYGELIEIDEQDRSARDKIAEIWLKKNEVGRAIQIYQALLNRDPNNGYCYAQIGRVLLKSGNNDRYHGETVLRKLLVDKPDIRDKDEIIKVINEIELAIKTQSTGTKQ